MSDQVTLDKVGVQSLLDGSEACESLGMEMVSLAKKVCPEHYDQFCELFIKYHNANSGPLHRWTAQKLEG